MSGAISRLDVLDGKGSRRGGADFAVKGHDFSVLQPAPDKSGGGGQGGAGKNSNWGRYLAPK